MTSKALVLVSLIACTMAFSLDIPNPKRLVSKMGRTLANTQKQTSAACQTAFEDAYGTSCGMSYSAYFDMLDSKNSTTPFCTSPCYMAAIAGLEAANALTTTNCDLSFVDSCASNSDCTGTNETCMTGYCRSPFSGSCSGFNQNGYCIEPSPTLIQLIANVKLICAQDASNVYCGDYIETHMDVAFNNANTTTEVCAAVESQTSASCCFASLFQCAQGISNSSTLCGLAAHCPFGPYETASAVCSGIQSDCAAANVNFCPAHDGYMCAKELHARGVALLDTTCTASEWRTEYEESFSFLNTALSSDSVGTFCSSDCHANFVTALDNTLSHESSNNLNCGKIWADIPTELSSSESEAADDDDTDDTDTDTDTDDSASSSKMFDDFELLQKVEIYIENVTDDGSYASLTIARNFFSGSCVSRGSDNCLLSYLSLIDGLAASTSPSCTQMNTEGCCTGVFSNCIAPALEVTDACTLAEACTSSANIDVGETTCLGGSSSACDVVCNPPADPSPAPRTAFKVKVTISLAGLTCDDVNSNDKATVVRNAVKRVVAAVTGVALVDISVSFDCSKQTDLKTITDIFVADSAAAVTAQSAVQGTNTATLTSDINTAVTDISAATGVTGIPTITGTTKEDPVVEEISTTSGGAVAMWTSMIFLFVSFLLM